MFEDFTGPLSSSWTQTSLGGGELYIADSALRMRVPATRQGHYTDAQIDDYGKKARSDFPWKPPVRLEVRARASHRAATAEDTSETPGILRGTAGFGFWNYPFSVRGDILMLPEAIWFFYASPPSNMALVPDVPGWGWKAQVVHSMRPTALASVIPTALTAGLARVTGDTKPAARWLQRLSGASERLLSSELTDWHTYTLDWQEAEAIFWVDHIEVLRVKHPPTRPLGFVAWLDNQYAIATPRGVMRFGATACPEEWFEMDLVRINQL